MNKDKEIDDLFKSFKPKVSSERLMTKITDKMDVIDMVSPERDQMIRFNRTVAVCCFIVGLLTGCFLMIIVLYHPFADNVVIDFMHPDNRFSEFGLFWTGHKDMILTLLAATSFILGSLPLINTNEWAKSL